MADILIYTKTICPYCEKAKFLLNKKNKTYREINLSNTPDAVEEMLEKSGGARTVPQIFIDGKHIEGGCDGLYALEEEGKLDGLLG